MNLKNKNISKILGFGTFHTGVDNTKGQVQKTLFIAYFYQMLFNIYEAGKDQP